jgi:hypothetical protein
MMETTRRGFFGAVAAALVATRLLPAVAAKAPPVAPRPGYYGTAGGGKSMALTFRGVPVVFDDDAPATRFYYVRRD